MSVIKNRPLRICIIGGGPAGLSTLYALTNTSGLNVDPVLFDKQSDFGGTWIFNSQVGIDYDRGGGCIPSAMYADLYTNGPKEALEWTQFTFDEAFDNIHFPSFPPREVLLEYQRRFANKFELYQYARFDSVVESVMPVTCDDDEGDKYEVCVRKVTKKKKQSEDDVENILFDKIVVCTGHFTKPYVPDINGSDAFKGTIKHACHIRDLTKLANQRVLAIGRSYSGESIVLESHKAGAKQITMSYRSRPNGLFDKHLTHPHNQQNGDTDKKPTNEATQQHDEQQQQQPYFMERPQVKAVLDDGETVEFVDGSHAKFDMMILCTGYMHTFPFMHSSVRLTEDDHKLNDLYIANLYNGVLLDHNPDIAYIGMQDLYYTNTLFMQQALWLALIYSGNILIPTTLSERQKHSEQWMKKLRACSKECDEDRIMFQTEHLNQLRKEMENARKDEIVPNVDVSELFIQWEQSRESDILTHREVCYTSVFTGSKASPPGKTWLEAKHVMEYMGESGKRMKMMDFHEKLGGLPFPPSKA